MNHEPRFISKGQGELSFQDSFSQKEETTDNFIVKETPEETSMESRPISPIQHEKRNSFPESGLVENSLIKQVRSPNSRSQSSFRNSSYSEYYKYPNGEDKKEDDVEEMMDDYFDNMNDKQVKMSVLEDSNSAESPSQGQQREYTDVVM